MKPLPKPTCWEKQTSGQKKLLGHKRDGGKTREVQVYPGITGFNRDMAAKGRPFGKEDAVLDPQLFLESTTSFLVWH